MLTSVRKGAAAFAAIATLFASAAQAETHEILVMEIAYFPEITYVQQGDTIVFKNDSTVTHTVRSSDGSWVLASIPYAGEATIQVTNNMVTDFGGSAWNSRNIAGSISFSAPPLE